MKNKDLFVESLRNRLLQPLPGEEVQFTMAPVGREKVKEIKSNNFNPKTSAVLILLFPFENSFSTILIKRAEYKGVHSGQMAFPGGGKEEQDINLEETALRETNEEIGVLAEDIEILGKLTDVYIIPSNYLVAPFIGVINKIPEIKMDVNEVQAVLNVNILEFTNQSVRGIKEIQQSNGIQLKTPYYEVGGYTIWGATAMMISELNALVEEIISA